MNRILVEAGEEPVKLHGEVTFMGKDLTVLIYGGKPHVGSVAVALPRPGLDDPEKTSATTSILNVPGHKDEHLARPVAQNLASHTDKVVTVIAGFHIDNITRVQIEQVLKNLESLEEKIIKACQGDSSRDRSG